MRNLAWHKFLDDIREIQQQLGCKEPGCRKVACKHLWYRGHADGVHYELLPSLFRSPDGVRRERSSKQIEIALKKTLDNEQILFKKYEQAATSLGTDGAKKEFAWETLFEMQHYYVPTRLLDWTSVLGVAVFFAAIKDMDVDSCVYVLNPYTLNKEATENTEIKTQASPDFDYRDVYLKHDAAYRPTLPVAIEPSFQNRRILAQKGKFTCHSNNFDPLDVQCPSAVRKVCLPKKARSGANEFLSQAGLNFFSIFPDMHGLAPFLRTELEIK